jgi:hypothetical protein
LAPQQDSARSTGDQAGASTATAATATTSTTEAALMMAHPDQVIDPWTAAASW